MGFFSNLDNRVLSNIVFRSPHTARNLQVHTSNVLTVSYVIFAILTDTRHIFFNVYSRQQFLYTIHSQISLFRKMSLALQEAIQFFFLQGH